MPLCGPGRTDRDYEEPERATTEDAQDMDVETWVGQDLTSASSESSVVER